MVSTPLHSITPFTLLDFPDTLAAIFWFSGCNLACSYCYNPEFLRQKGRLSLEEARRFLLSRQGLLEGVVFSGGEASLVAEIGEWAEMVKNLGFKLKLDTNGTNPKALEGLLKGGWLDYVALDFKGSERRFEAITGKNLYGRFLESLALLQGSGVDFEVRTTVHSELLGAEDIRAMARVLSAQGYDGTLYLQSFIGEKPTLKPLPPSNRFPLESEIEGVNIIWR